MIFTNEFEPYDLQFDNEKRKKMFSEALKELRILNKMTQKQVAEKLGIKYTTYNGYEKGTNEPPLETIVRLAFLFGCTTDLLLQKNNLIGSKEDVKKTVEELPEIIKKVRVELLEKNGDSETMILANAIKDLTEAMTQFNLKDIHENK